MLITAWPSFFTAPASLCRRALSLGAALSLSLCLSMHAAEGLPVAETASFSTANPAKADTLVGAAQQAREELNALAKNVPVGNTEALLTELHGKNFGFNLREESVAFWEAVARDGDVGRTGSPGQACSLLTQKGFVFGLFNVPKDGVVPPAPPTEFLAHAKGYTIADKATEEDMVALAKEAHAAGKLFFANPSASQLALWGAAHTAEFCKDVDIVNLQVESWYFSDASETKDTFVNNVVTYSAAIRVANPNCKIFLDIGRGAVDVNSLASQWLTMLTFVHAKNAACYDGIYLASPVQDSKDPKKGFPQIKQMLAWMRP